MDFRLDLFADAFRDADYSIKHESFSGFAFILASRADKNVFPDLVLHLSELHHLTAENLLVIAPKISMGKGYREIKNAAFGEPTGEVIWMNAHETSQVLAKKSYFNYLNGETVDVSHVVDEFLERQTSESYAFARFIGLDVSEIPCVVFFDTLQTPDRYIHWSLEGTSASDVVMDFRIIVAAIEKVRTKGTEVNILDIIHNLDRKRFAFKFLQELGRAVKMLTNFLT